MYLAEYNAYIQWPNTMPRTDNSGSIALSLDEILKSRYVLLCRRQDMPLVLDVIKCRVSFERTEWYQELLHEFPSIIYRKVGSTGAYNSIAVTDASEAVQFMLKYR